MSRDAGDETPPHEDPYELARRLRLGREEYCQRLLTSLVVGGAYPRWNTRTVPSPRGTAFLRALDVLSFGAARWAEGAVFVDELDLSRRHDDECGGAPDQAVLWPDRLWLIELKTERGSHRRDQLPSYYVLAGHHYPDLPVDITYLTPTMTVAAPVVDPPNRYAHISWSIVASLVAEAWSDTPDSAERQVVDVLLGCLARLDLSVAEWREWLTDAGSAAPLAPAAGREALPGLADALLTAEDGRQRAVDVDAGGLDRLQALRLELRAALAAHPAGSPAQHVRPWLWSLGNTGRAMTRGGQQTGYELRLSRYRRAVA